MPPAAGLRYVHTGDQGAFSIFLLVFFRVLRKVSLVSLKVHSVTFGLYIETKLHAFCGITCIWLCFA